MTKVTPPAHKQRNVTVHLIVAIHVLFLFTLRRERKKNMSRVNLAPINSLSPLSII